MDPLGCAMGRQLRSDTRLLIAKLRACMPSHRQRILVLLVMHTTTVLSLIIKHVQPVLSMCARSLSLIPPDTVPDLQHMCFTRRKLGYGHPVSITW